MYLASSLLPLHAWLLVITVFTALSEAYPSFRTHIPNGDRVPCEEGMEGCVAGDTSLGQPAMACFGLGHRTCEGGTFPLNSWGKAFQAAEFKWTKTLCQEDADGDGQTNGEELGDPCCEWKYGDKPSEYMRTFIPSHPGSSSHTQPSSYSKPTCGTNATKPAKHAPLLGTFNENEEQRSRTFQIKDYTIPSQHTVYVDVYFNLDDDEHDLFHLIGGEAIIKNKLLVHHFVVTGCASKIPKDMVGVAVPEDSRKFHVECNNALGGFAGWAPGGGNLFPLPVTAGISIGKAVGCVAFKINVHYTDGEKYPGTVDQSGIKIFYTPVLRQYTIRNNLILAVGGHHEISVPPGKDRWFMTRSCTVSSLCADAPDHMIKQVAGVTCSEGAAMGMCGREEAKKFCPVACGLCKHETEFQVWGAFHHAHLIGTEMYMDRKRDNQWMDFGSMPIWHFDDQAMAPMMTKELTLREGDKLQSACVFNSTQRKEATRFGQSTYDEMCFNMVATIHPTDAVADFMPFAFTCRKGFSFEEDSFDPLWVGELAVGEDAHKIAVNHGIEKATNIWSSHIMGEAGEFIGKISTETWLKVAQPVIAYWDANGDGALNFAELNATMQKLPSEWGDAKFDEATFKAMCGDSCPEHGLDAERLVEYVFKEVSPEERKAVCKRVGGMYPHCCKAKEGETAGPSALALGIDLCQLCPNGVVDKLAKSEEDWSCSETDEWMRNELPTDKWFHEGKKKRLLPRLYMSLYIENLKKKVAAKADESTNCPESFIAWQGSCYLQEVKGQMEHEPSAFCKSKGAHLPTIHSNEENEFVAFLYGAKGWSSEMRKAGIPWEKLIGEDNDMDFESMFQGVLGLRRKTGTATSQGWRPEDWEWDDGSAITYTNWVGEEPSNHGEDGPGTGREPHWENFAIIREYGWIDAGEYPGAIYVCEIDGAATTPDEPAKSTGAGTTDVASAASLHNLFPILLEVLVVLYFQ